jgi:hypothetical protein
MCTFLVACPSPLVVCKPGISDSLTGSSSKNDGTLAFALNSVVVA